MAQIDVTELLCDPDFVDDISLITRKPLVNSFGELKIEETIENSIGSVQPATGKVLQRIPEALRLNDYSTFWFKGQIIASEPGKYASILVFKGKRYQIQSIQDWSNFGAGYTEGLCVAEVIAP